MKRLIITILLTLILNIIMLPLCSSHLIKSVFDSRYTNNNIRVEVYNSSNKDNALNIISNNTISKLWYDKKNNGVSIDDDLIYEWQEYKICTQAVHSGELLIYLRGPDKRVNNERYPVIVDYRSFKVNGTSVFDEKREFWSDNSFIFKLKVKDGECVNISFDARKHHFKISDITQIYQTNLWILFAMTVFLFFLSYELVNYVAKIQLLEHRNWIDIIFVVFFFVLLFVPMCKIDKADKSNQENRMLAKEPTFLNEKGINPKYGLDAEKWFNDRFWGRSLAINLDSVVRMFLNRVYVKGGALYFPNNNWMFSTRIPQAPGKKETVDIGNQLKIFNQFCKQNNIKLYILIVPCKEYIYHEILESNYRYPTDADNRYVQYLDDLRQMTEIPIIYPYDELRNACSSDFVFFKQAHHWTEWGAYCGYQALIKEIARDFPTIKNISLNDYKKFTSKLIRDEWEREFHTGWTTRLLGFKPEYAKKHLLKDDYVYYDHKSGDSLLVSQTSFIKYYAQDTGGGYKMLVAGDSQNENLMQFLPYSAKELKYIRLNKTPLPTMERDKFLKYHRKEVTDYRPDILVISIYQTRATNIFKNIN